MSTSTTKFIEPLSKQVAKILYKLRNLNSIFKSIIFNHYNTFLKVKNGCGLKI
jgi:hypothetical protein